MLFEFKGQLHDLPFWVAKFSIRSSYSSLLILGFDCHQSCCKLKNPPIKLVNIAIQFLETRDFANIVLAPKTLIK